MRDKSYILRNTTTTTTTKKVEFRIEQNKKDNRNLLCFVEEFKYIYIFFIKIIKCILFFSIF